MEHGLERNRLKGVASDALNAILSAAAMNFQKLPGAFGAFFCSAWGAPGVGFRPYKSDSSSKRSLQMPEIYFFRID